MTQRTGTYLNLLKILKKVKCVKLPYFKGKRIEKEIILVDDCSKNKSREILRKIKM